MVEISFEIDPKTARMSDVAREARIAFSRALTDTQASESFEGLFRQWRSGQEFEQGEVIRFEYNLFRVNQTHTSQDGWLPTDTPALFSKLGTEEEVASGAPPWRQPTGGHDAYNIGDRVIYSGKVWESTVNSNVWAPSVFGWRLAS